MSQHSAVKVKDSPSDLKQMLGVNQDNEVKPVKGPVPSFLPLGQGFGVRWVEWTGWSS